MSIRQLKPDMSKSQLLILSLHTGVSFSAHQLSKWHHHSSQLLKPNTLESSLIWFSFNSSTPDHFRSLPVTSLLLLRSHRFIPQHRCTHTKPGFCLCGREIHLKQQVEPSPPFSSGLPLIPSIFLVLDWKAFSVAQKPFMMWRYLAASPNSSSLFASSSAVAPVAPSLLLLQLTKHTPASGTRCRTASA